jgi:hypothetical protein
VIDKTGRRIERERGKAEGFSSTVVVLYSTCMQCRLRSAAGLAGVITTARLAKYDYEGRTWAGLA